MNCILDYLSRLIIMFLSAADSPREKLLRHLSCHPFNALVYTHLINKLSMHQQNMRSSRNLPINVNRKNNSVVLLIALSQHILPCALIILALETPARN